MNIRIGVVQSQKEIELELADDSDPEVVKETINSSLASGGVLWLTDSRGREVGFPASSVAYVELDPATSGRSIGFGS